MYVQNLYAFTLFLYLRKYFCLFLVKHQTLYELSKNVPMQKFFIRNEDKKESETCIAILFYCCVCL